MKMIDFENSSVFKLKKANKSTANEVLDLFVPGEELVSCYKGARDYVVFTTKRIFVINVQGLTGKKIDFSSLPYSKIQAFSVETAGTFDLDSELELWFSGLGKVRLEFVNRANISEICRMISERVL